MFVSAHYLAPDLLLEIVILLLPQRHGQRNHLIKQPFYDVPTGLVLGVGIAAVRAIQVSRQIDRDLPIELLEKLTFAITVILIPLGFGDYLRTPGNSGQGGNGCVLFCVRTCGAFTSRGTRTLRNMRCC